jgi:hypothetical protein
MSSQRSAASSKLCRIRLVGAIASRAEWCERFQETRKTSRKTCREKTAEREALFKLKKEQGEKPCSENCVDPFVSPKIGFDLD